MNTPEATRAGLIQPVELDKVQGSAEFVADVMAPDALHAAFTLSAEAHARIVRIDTGPALELPGVVAVLTGADIGEVLVGRIIQDYPVLATDRVLFAGQRVAAVAAVDAKTARRAAALVDVEYEPLPTIPDIETALATPDDVLHPRYFDYVGALPHRPGPNTQGIWTLSSGSPEAIEECEPIFDDSFTVSHSHPAPLEPHGCLVSAGEVIEIWAAHKEPYSLRNEVARISGRPIEDVRIHLVHIGGDFGAKGFGYVEYACYFLSVATGRPVRTHLTYAEVLTSTHTRHPATIRLRTGLKSGRFHAHHADVLLDGGAFGAPKAAPMLVVPTVGYPLGSYALEHRHDSSISVYTNNVPGGHVRAPGEVQALFAGESHVDMIANRLGVDPLELRYENALNDTVRELLDEMRPVVERWRAERAPSTGVGIALCYRNAGGGTTTVRLRAERGRGIELQVTVPDTGAGAYPTLRRIVAAALSISFDQVRIVTTTAESGLEDDGAGASRVTAVVGGAARNACDALLRELGLDAPPVAAGEGWLDAALAPREPSWVEVTATHTVDYGSMTSTERRSYAGIAVEVHVDVETGKVTPLRGLIVADTGAVLNPVGHLGQLEGGFVYGLSQTLIEDLTVEDGRVTTASLGDYRLATAGDIPPLDVRVLPPRAEDQAGRIRSVGELTNTGVAPAVANAIHDAVGVRLTHLPITAESVLTALTVPLGA